MHLLLGCLSLFPSETRVTIDMIILVTHVLTDGNYILLRLLRSKFQNLKAKFITGHFVLQLTHMALRHIDTSCFTLWCTLQVSLLYLKTYYTTVSVNSF